MRQYLDLLQMLLDKGVQKSNRTGVDTLALFGHQMRIDLSEGFPLLTTKKLHLKSVIHELLWFLQGNTNIDYLKKNGVSIWDEWADENGELGPVYGCQWRNFGARRAHLTDLQGVDQVSWLINEIKTNPDSRRLILSAWNPVDLPMMALPPCHVMSHFSITDDKLSCLLYQRSADTFLGVPFNIASYSLLTMMIAQVCGLKLGEFIHTFGDVHLYVNHVEQAKLQLTREPKKLPTMKINPEVKSIFDFKYEDFTLENYDAWPSIKAPIAV